MCVVSFKQSPTSRSVQHFLEHATDSAGANPKYIISDKSQQSWCDLFKDWRDGQGITPRFGAIGQHGSIALIERFILTLKIECMRISLLPFRTDALQRELTCFANWYNHSHPHSALDGRTPHEVLHDVSPADQRLRFEPRARWPRKAPCASPHAPVAGHCGTPIHLDVLYYSGRQHLPIVELRPAA